MFYYTGEQKYFDFIKGNLDQYIDNDGNIKTYKLSEYNIDNIKPAGAALFVYQITGEEKYKIAIDTLRKQLDGMPRTKSGGFWHKKIYPFQMWLDGIYMADAFWAQYEATFATRHSPFATCAWDDIAHQVILIEQRTRDPITGLLYHAWDESKQQRWANPITGCSPHFWGRAMGWYGMAIVDILDFFPREHPQRGALIAILNRMCDALARVQDPRTGVWWQVLDQGGRPGNYLESSASCMFVYTMVKGARHRYLPITYLEVAQRAYQGILKEFVRVDDVGQVHLTNTCQSAGLGGNPYRDGSFEYYISEPRVTNNHHGVGAFILASAEIEQMPGF
jgi:unsaturated rhamnogalacturonyl hydrolase